MGGGGGGCFLVRGRPQTGEAPGRFWPPNPPNPPNRGVSGGGTGQGGSTASMRVGLTCIEALGRGVLRRCAEPVGGPLGWGRARTHSRGGTKCPRGRVHPRVASTAKSSVDNKLLLPKEKFKVKAARGCTRPEGAREGGRRVQSLFLHRGSSLRNAAASGGGEACGPKSRASRACVSCLQMHPFRNWGQGCKGEEEKRKT